MVEKPNERFPVRLQRLAKAWQRMCEPTLEKRQKMLRSWASGFYDKGYGRTHTLNLIDRGVSTLVPFLIEGNPQVMVDSKVANLRPWAYTTQLALNQKLKEMKVAKNVFIPCAINSMFGQGITRTSFVYDRIIDLKDDQPIKAGQPWIDVIDESNYIGDTSAKRRCDFAFEGDVYKLPTNYARDLFSKHADHIQPDGKLASKWSPEFITNDNEREKLSLRDFTTFIDLYLFEEGRTVTVMPEGRKATILNSIEWKGPGDGPYDTLWYKPFPESPIPLPPAWSWMDMDTSINILVDKMREQAENSKKVLVSGSGLDEKEAKKVLEARNLQHVTVEGDPSDLNVLDLVQINPNSYQWVAYMEDQHTKQGANPDILGGRGPSAPTLGQEQMIHNNATRIVNNMYTRFQDFMTSVIEKLAWHYWTDPSSYTNVVKKVSGVGELPVVFSSVDKVGEFYDYVYDIVPYSSQRLSPEQRYSRTMQFMTQWILPTMEFARMQGAEIDIPTVSKILSTYAGVSSFDQWYKSAIPTVEQRGLPFQMQPMQSHKDVGTGQTNDAFGALPGSREANKDQQQDRTTGSVGGLE